MRDKALGYLFLALAMATVGTTVVASKLISDGIAPFTATAMRFALALPVLVTLVIARRERLPHLSAGTWAALALQAGVGSVGYTVLLILGLSFLPAVDAGVVIGTLPAVTALFAVVVLGERPGARVVLAVVAATTGVVALAWRGSGPSSFIGILLVLGAVACESAFILLQKRLGTPLVPLMQASAMTGLGLLLSFPVALVEGQGAGLPFTALAGIVWYALVPTVGGFLLWYAGAARVPGAEAAVFTAVAPVTAVFLSAVVLGEPVGLAQGIGLAAVAVAIVVLSMPARKAASPRKSV